MIAQIKTNDFDKELLSNYLAKQKTCFNRIIHLNISD